MATNKETPSAGTPGETITVPISEYGHGSYAMRELVNSLRILDPKLHSVNLLLE